MPTDELPEFLAARERGEMVSAEDIMAEGFRYATSADDTAEDAADDELADGEALAEAEAEEAAAEEESDLEMKVLTSEE